jgi:hypothetical protein
MLGLIFSVVDIAYIGRVLVANVMRGDISGIPQAKLIY